MAMLEDSPFIVRICLWMIMGTIAIAIWTMFLLKMGYESQAFEVAQIVSYWGPPVILTFVSGVLAYAFFKGSMMLGHLILSKEAWASLYRLIHR